MIILDGNLSEFDSKSRTPVDSHNHYFMIPPFRTSTLEYVSDRIVT